MLHLLLGRAGAGKSSAIFRRIAESGGARPQLLLVPEQASHETERRLCQAAGNQVSRYAEVLSFTRLSSRVLARAGGLASPALDAGGRMLLMYAALKAVSGQLTVYAKPSRKPAFLSGLLATLDECKQYGVTPARLSEAGGETGGQEGEKLRDLGLIFGAYDAMTGRTAFDPRDRLTRLARGLRDCGWAKGYDIYVDGFTDFTPQERSVLEQLLCQGESLTVALTCCRLEEADGEAGIFRPARRTAEALCRMASGCGCAVEIQFLTTENICKAKKLSYIEKQLFSDVPVPCAGEEGGELTLFRAELPRSEVEWTASEILRLVREEGFRFRDIAVAARGFDRYAPLVEEVFARYGVPVFLDSMTDVLQKPIFAVVTGALDTVAGNYVYEDVFRYLKTGLTDVTPEECDLLENYVLTWRLRGSRWTAKADWTMHPRGYGFPMTEVDTALLDTVNAVRRKVTEPLEKLRINKLKTGYGQAISLYEFLEKINLPGRLNQRAEMYRVQGELKRAEEYGQLWDILCGGLEQCAALLGDTPMELEEFSALLKLVLSQYDVGTIPVSLDRVAAGEAGRQGNRAVGALFFLGADDGAIPQVAPAPGLLNDDDRSLLASYGLELAPRAVDKLDREMTILYETCARPTRRLAVSWAAMSPQGEEKRPAFLIGRLRRLFPGLKIQEESRLDGAFRLSAPRPALELAGKYPAVRQALAAMPDYAGPVRRMEQAASMKRGSLSSGAALQLYGRNVPMSASRMDRYKSCHFSYFMQYGLKARPRREAGFQAPEYGTFVHYVLEEILKDPESGNWDRGRVRVQVREVMERYIQEELGGLAGKTARFVYLFERLLRPVTQVVWNALEELASSEFRPISFELGFGEKGDLPPVSFTVDGVTVSISGFVDRVDGWVHNGRLYLRVVDYKTGRKSFDLTEIWNGLGLQMLLYLFTLNDKGKILYKMETEAAGILYLPAREAVIRGSRTMGEESRQKQADQELRRNGLLLDDPAVLEAMEAPGDEGMRFLPLRVSKRTGAITGDALVTAERLGRLRAHTKHILHDIGAELAAGNIMADPYWRGPEKNACLYCDYVQACHFEEGRGGDRQRWLPPLDGAAFWDALERRDEPDRR